MDRVTYFIDKAWTFAVEEHPMVSLMLFILAAILFYIFKYIILKIRPQTARPNTTAVAMTVVIGMPLFGLIVFLLIAFLQI